MEGEVDVMHRAAKTEGDADARGDPGDQADGAESCEFLDNTCYTPDCAETGVTPTRLATSSTRPLDRTRKDANPQNAALKRASTS